MAVTVISTSGVWNSTLFVANIDSPLVGSGSWIGLSSDPNNFIFQVVTTSASGVTIVNPSGLTIPSGT
jgi:hypothetical protein